MMFRIGVLLLCLLMTACADDSAPRKAAPVGDRAVLEGLAKEYNKLAETVPNSPWKLAPDQRKKFVEQVFAAGGYSYAATLHQMAEGGWNAGDQNVKDLAALLFMPHTNVSAPEGLKGVYSEQELADVRKVQAMLP